MIFTSTFVGQVMKFDELKELGSESAVKVCPHFPATSLVQVPVSSFDLQNSIVCVL
jgi:hypothetical protein